jgi:Flp pilus assembly pilin Flp
MKASLSRYGRDEAGTTAIEYCVIAGAVALAVLTAYWTFGDSLQTRLYQVAAAIGLEQPEAGGRGIVLRTSPERD